MATSEKTPLQIEEGSGVTSRKGLTVLTAMLFVVGDVAGGGLLTFPKALSQIGWVGVLVVLTFSAAAAYTASLIGRCWTIVCERHEEYRDKQVGHPYPLIGELAFGRSCSKLISFCVNFTCCGACVGYLLMVAEQLRDLFPALTTNYGYWVIILAAVLCPVCWLGTPKDFWLIALSASLSTAIASVFIFAQIMKDSREVPPAFHASIDFKGFLMAYGIISFGFGGHQVFPTIQVDMKKQENFGVAAAIGYAVILCIYLPVTVAGFVVYGSNLHGNVLMSLTQGPLNFLAMLLISLHLIAGFVLILNPVSQELEDLFKVPKGFCLRRVIVRTIIVGVVMFVALTLPQFDAILSLVGGSTVTMTSFIMPPLCYLKLCSMKGDWRSIDVPLYEKVLCIEIVIVGVLCGVAATYTSLDALLYSHFSKPLYLS